MSGSATAMALELHADTKLSKSLLDTFPSDDGEHDDRLRDPKDDGDRRHQMSSPAQKTCDRAGLRCVSVAAAFWHAEDDRLEQ